MIEFYIPKKHIIDDTFFEYEINEYAMTIFIQSHFAYDDLLRIELTGRINQFGVHLINAWWERQGKTVVQIEIFPTLI